MQVNATVTRTVAPCRRVERRPPAQRVPPARAAFPAPASADAIDDSLPTVPPVCSSPSDTLSWLLSVSQPGVVKAWLAVLPKGTKVRRVTVRHSVPGGASVCVTRSQVAIAMYLGWAIAMHAW
jgi:hypothetical protein